LGETIKDWKDLFRLACIFLESADIPSDRWTMGGGTVLMLHYNHRISKDIDIFFSDAQYLTYLTPRLNDVVEKYTKDYDEQSNFIKLKFGNGEIDFIVAPNLTGRKPIILNVEGIPVRTDPPEEIVIKKIFYRTESLKARDVIDIAVVIKNIKPELLKHIDIYAGKIKRLSERLNLIKTNYEEAIKHLEIQDRELAREAPSIVEDFLQECLKSP
jgi:hypothetical protein